MQITRASDYAVRVMIHLAGLPPASTVRQSELSRATDVSGHFLSKVLQQLVRSRLIRSQRGAGGGFALAMPATGISLLDVVEAIEGPLRLNQCLSETPSCDRRFDCPAHKVWIEAQEAVVKVLGSASMASLAAQAKTDPATLYGLHNKTTNVAGAQEKSGGKRTAQPYGH